MSTVYRDLVSDIDVHLKRRGEVINFDKENIKSKYYFTIFLGGFYSIYLFDIEDKGKVSYILKEFKRDGNNKLKYIENKDCVIVDSDSEGNYTLMVNRSFYINIFPKFGYIEYNYVTELEGLCINGVYNEGEDKLDLIDYNNKGHDKYYPHLRLRDRLMSYMERLGDCKVVLVDDYHERIIVEVNDRDNTYYYLIKDGSGIKMLNYATLHNHYLYYYHNEGNVSTMKISSGDYDNCTYLLLSDKYFIGHDYKDKKVVIIDRITEEERSVSLKEFYGEKVTSQDIYDFISNKKYFHEINKFGKQLWTYCSTDNELTHG